MLAHHIGVKSEPSVKIVDLNQNYKTVTIASGGVWAHMTPEEVSKVISERQVGKCCDAILSKIKEISKDPAKVINDTSAIISSL